MASRDEIGSVVRTESSTRKGNSQQQSCWSYGVVLEAPLCPTGDPSRRNAGCASRPRAMGVRKRMLVPGSTLNASLLVLVLGAFGKLSLQKGECTHPEGAWKRAEMIPCLAVVPVQSPEDKGEVVLQLKGSTVAECPEITFHWHAPCP